jgi:hypothetical protein
VSTAYLTALALTLLIEVPVYVSVLRHGLNVSAQPGLAAGAAVNLISHPVAFLIVMPALDRPLGFFPALVVIEAGVWVLESLLLWLWLRRDLDLVSLAALLANVASLAVGLGLILAAGA